MFNMIKIMIKAFLLFTKRIEIQQGQAKRSI